MYNNSIQIYESEHFGNGWGFYVDIENSYTTNIKRDLFKEKYYKNYYNRYDKIDEEFEYYESEYNKRMEKNSNQIQETDIIKNSSLALLFHVTSLTFITIGLSYCFLGAL